MTNHLHIIDLRVQNYKSFMHQLHFVFDRHQLTLVNGRNTSGKSTMKHSLLWALYGRIFDGAKVSDVICRYSSGPLRTHVRFRILGSVYEIIRTARPSSIEVYQDGVRIMEGEKKMADVQKRLNREIFKMSASTFVALTMQGKNNSEIFMTAKPADRRIMIEDILGINRIAKMQEAFKERRALVIDTITKITSEMDVKKAEIATSVAHNNSLEVNVEEIRAKKREQIATKKEKLKEKKAALAALEAKLATAEQEFSGLVVIDKGKIDATKEEIHGAKKRIDDAKKALEFYKANSDCPTCHQPITDSFKQATTQAHQKEADKANTELTVRQDDLKKMQEIEDFRINKAAEMTGYRADIRDVKVAIDILTLAIEELEDDVKNLVDKKLAPVDLAPFEERLKFLQEKYDNAVIWRKRLDIALFLCSDGYGRAMILRRYLPFINQTVNKFATEQGFTGQIELVDTVGDGGKASKGLEIKVYMQNHETTYEVCSSGEKQRISNSFVYTWRELAKRMHSASCNIFIQDETVDASLDPQGIDDYVRFLRTHLKNDNIIIISHSEKLASQSFDRTLYFEKWRNSTKVEEI